jgi:hypothetical protein
VVCTLWLSRKKRRRLQGSRTPIKPARSIGKKHSAGEALPLRLNVLRNGSSGLISDGAASNLVPGARPGNGVQLNTYSDSLGPVRVPPLSLNPNGPASVGIRRPGAVQKDQSSEIASALLRSTQGRSSDAPFTLNPARQQRSLSLGVGHRQIGRCIPMPSSFEPYLPPTRLQFPHGAVLSIGTVRCDDQIHEAVYLGYTPAGSTTATMALELPPKSLEVVIRQLQDRANQARFINGVDVLEYPEPYPVRPSRPRARPQQRRLRKKKTGQRVAPPNGGPATPVERSRVTEGPSSVS